MRETRCVNASIIGPSDYAFAPDYRMSEIGKPNNWLGRVICLILLEKLFAMLCFACINFIIPFGADWLKHVLLALPGLLVIDLIYGRIAFYAAAGAYLKLSKSTNPFLEGGVYFLSLILSLGLVIAVTGQAEILLFYGKQPWNCIAYSLISVAGIIAVLLSLYLRAERRKFEPTRNHSRHSA